MNDNEKMIEVSEKRMIEIYNKIIDIEEQIYINQLDNIDLKLIELLEDIEYYLGDIR